MYKAFLFTLFGIFDILSSVDICVVHCQVDFFFLLFYCACRSCGVLNQVGSFCWINSGK